MTLEKASSALTDTKDRLDQWRKDRNRSVNDVEIVLNLPQGQIEVELDASKPIRDGAILITSNEIDKLNKEIEVRPAEAKPKLTTTVIMVITTY